MADFSPTPEQRSAITARGAALLISAGAGSGKTRVLTERLMSYLTDEAQDCNVTDFLIITYTRAAAAELRTRILSAISDELVKNPKNRRLRREAALVHHAEIDTIHSFCGRILREHAHRLNISPDFRIAEESECEVVKSAVMSRLLDSRYEHISSFEGFEQLVDTLSPGRDDNRLAETTLDMFEKLSSHTDSGQWISGQLKQLAPGSITNVLETPWGELLIKKARDSAEFWLGRINALLSENSDSPEVMKAYGGSFSSVASQLRRFLEACEISWDNAMCASAFDFPRAKPLRGDGYEDIKTAWKSCRDELRALSDVFVANSNELIADMDAVYPATKALFALVSDFSELYLDEKNRRRVVDFSDLEHFALALLTDSNGPNDLAREIGSRYIEIMVDEYQDVSAIQEQIFGAVSKNGKNLVMVGDVRQSIYRFRLAEPSIFLNKYRCFSNDINALERRIILADNFRSRANILNAVNYVFSGVMSERFGEMDYTEREFLRAGRPDAVCDIPVELRIIAPDESENDPPDRRVLEAEYVARRTNALIEEGFQIPDGDGTRPAKYSDIVILLRSRTYAHLFREALISRGIPVETDESDSLLDAYEVRLALAFLYIADNPRNDIPLISVLRFYGFTPDELADIRLCDRDGLFYDALLLYSEKNDKAQAFLKQLHEFRTLAPELGADGLLRHIYNCTHLPAKMSALPQGEVRYSNLIQLASEAQNAATFGYSGVFAFLRFLERLKNPIGCFSSQSSGGVRIMTVHKSKGLEFPIVFLVDMAHRFNMQDTKKRLLFHPELGVGQKLVDLQRQIEYPTLSRIAIAEKIARESKAEELRVLYVAMTRAREKLIMVYSDTDHARTLEKLREPAGYPVSPHVLNRQLSIGNILLTVLLLRPEAASLFGEDTPNGLFDMKIVRMQASEPEKFAADAHETVPGAAEAAVPEIVYPYPFAPMLPSKLTVTELKNRILDSELSEDAETIRISKNFEDCRKPKFGTTEITGAALGTATHAAMRYIPLRKYADLPELRREIDLLGLRGLITADECAAVDERRIMRFLESPLGMRAISAPELFREFKFSLLVPAKEFFDYGGDDEILFQGVVDLAFRERDSIVVVDFKTDRIYSDDSLNEKNAVYKPQIESYMRALHRVTGMASDEGYIYFLHADKAVRV